MQVFLGKLISKFLFSLNFFLQMVCGEQLKEVILDRFCTQDVWKHIQGVSDYF